MLEDYDHSFAFRFMTAKIGALKSLLGPGSEATLGLTRIQVLLLDLQHQKKPEPNEDDQSLVEAFHAKARIATKDPDAIIIPGASLQSSLAYELSAWAALVCHTTTTKPTGDYFQALEGFFILLGRRIDADLEEKRYA